MKNYKNRKYAKEIKWAQMSREDRILSKLHNAIESRKGITLWTSETKSRVMRERVNQLYLEYKKLNPHG